MASERALYFRVKVRDLFRPDDPLVPPLLQLMPAVNDLRTLQKVWLYADSRVGTTPSEEEIIKAEKVYLFLITCATAYEAALAFQEIREVLAAPSGQGAVGAMPDEAREAFHTLAKLFPANFVEGTSHGKILVRLRNSIFHYSTPRVYRTELERHDELATLIIGSRIGASRYVLADDLQVQILEQGLGGRFEDQARELMRLIVEVARCFGNFVDGMVGMYVRANRGAIIERREDTVDMERLWNITAEPEQRGPRDG